jgi:hypothetical protein
LEDPPAFAVFTVEGGLLRTSKEPVSSTPSKSFKSTPSKSFKSIFFSLRVYDSGESES